MLKKGASLSYLHVFSFCKNDRVVFEKCCKTTKQISVEEPVAVTGLPVRAYHNEIRPTYAIN